MKQRIITAVIALPIFLVVLLSGNKDYVGLLLTACAGISTYEAVSMLVSKFEGLVSDKKYSNRALLLSVVSSVLIVFSLYVWGPEYSSVVMGFLFYFLGLIIVSFISGDNALAVVRIAAIVVGVSYGSFGWFFIWDLFSLQNGIYFVGLLCTIVWSGDTGAYFGGKSFGKHKLAPRMSPNKTWEGSVSGILCSSLGAYIFCYFSNIALPTSGIIGMAILAGMTAQIGDLVESTVKRFSDVKDSGFIFPGHGGLLDRVDGVIFAAPVVWAFIHYIL